MVESISHIENTMELSDIVHFALHCSRKFGDRDKDPKDKIMELQNKVILELCEEEIKRYYEPLVRNKVQRSSLPAHCDTFTDNMRFINSVSKFVGYIIETDYYKQSGTDDKYKWLDIETVWKDYHNLINEWKEPNDRSFEQFKRQLLRDPDVTRKSIKIEGGEKEVYIYSMLKHIDKVLPNIINKV